MFNIFKKKEPGVRVIDKIVMTGAAKWNALLEKWKKSTEIIFIFWFDETRRQAESFFPKESGAGVNFYMAREIPSHQLVGRPLLFAEHYPLAEKERELFEKLQLEEAEVWSAMDEPLFKEFGSDKIVQMMKQFGMKDDQVIEHNMVSKAILTAQEKIGKKVLLDQSSASQEEWLRMNWRN
jgi:hypothetical protein